MHYSDGPLEVTRPDTDFVFTVELGQGSRGFVHAGGDLKESVQQLRTATNQPTAFLDAVERLSEIGADADWDWERIAKQSAE